MGMDLIPKNEGVNPFYANWTSWDVLGGALEALGCNTSRMAGMNDGDLVTEEEARAWGAALHDALRRGLLVSRRVFSPHHVGDGYFHIVPRRDQESEVLRREDRELLREFADFCLASGGFEQW